jgi:hypothetical protein
MIPPTVQGLAALIGQTSEETLHLTLDTLLIVLTTGGEVHARVTRNVMATIYAHSCFLWL